jgi:hypothetical protein
MKFEEAKEKWIIDMKKLIPEHYRFCGKILILKKNQKII